MKYLSYASTALIMLFITSLGFAQEPTGYEIMQEMLNQSTWDAMQAKVTLTLKTSRGETRVRTIDFYSKNTRDDESRMLMRFTRPADVEGTGFLMIEHDNAEDERYLYLPALRRVKRIAASGSGGNFMSSDFTYYDIGEPELEDWTYKRLADTTIADQKTYVIESLPKTDQISEDTGYGKIIRYVLQDKLNNIKTVYFDESLQKKKILNVKEYTEVNGTDFESNMVMHDVQIDHTSIMEFDDIQTNTGIPDDFFSQRYLQRMR
ncbi:MAG: outer membrane lipoprotein-sorting protein [Candidatus Marinimicrobia bacterium]|nr:outer membrane lipoprotein-sorting protein [Candidatus Neomarinimicrobiota bacterium]MCF7827854.1 outer membrane lipoprotein-sorting protein [Candidatus Neomarinimicrobiota bacterium]MCF7879391.1 outer membrane lipoprotein-sorting protein [Candidatus Neomarinimicrobiota bacterium]